FKGQLPILQPRTNSNANLHAPDGGGKFFHEQSRRNRHGLGPTLRIVRILLKKWNRHEFTTEILLALREVFV
ncbi:MAG: hypothetical protein ACKPJJ_35990, partial [Planctomycetaceae bacterium]